MCVSILSKLGCSMVMNHSPIPSCLVAFSNELFRTTTRLSTEAMKVTQLRQWPIVILKRQQICQQTTKSFASSLKNETRKIANLATLPQKAVTKTIQQ